MKKRILLIGYNFKPEPTGVGKYSGEMVDWLTCQGYSCSVVTAYPYYPYWRVQEPYRKKRFWFTTEKQHSKSGGLLTVYRCPKFVPSSPTGKNRILADLSFFISALLRILTLLPKKKYDFVISVSPSFQTGLLGAFYRFIKQARHIYHIQDLQIEAARDLELIKSQRLLRILFRLENYIFKKSDVITSISESMVAKIEQKCKKKVLLFPNWVDTTFFFPIIPKGRLKKEYGFQPSDTVVLYSGAVGEKQGLEAILLAAKAFQGNSQVQFVICGSGPYKSILMQKAEKMKLIKLRFFDLQPMDKFNAFLNIADVHLVIQKSTAGDLVMPSKLTTILAIGGLAIITADDGTGLYDLVQRYQMGILVPAENQQALVDALKNIIDSDTANLIRNNALTYAKNYLNIDNVLQSFEKNLS